MKDYKQIFIDYCKDKIVTDGEGPDKDELYFKEDDADYTDIYHICLVCDVREFDDCIICLNDYGDDNMYGFVRNGDNYEMVIDTLQYNAFQLAAELRFKSINKSFYDSVLKYWDETYMTDIMIENENKEDTFVPDDDFS